MEVTLNKCKGITKGVRALPHNAMECEKIRRAFGRYGVSVPDTQAGRDANTGCL